MLRYSTFQKYDDSGDDDNVEDDDDLSAIIPFEPTELNMVDMPKFNTLKLKVICQQRCQKPKSWSLECANPPP